jgi:hypothetical protein
VKKNLLAISVVVVVAIGVFVFNWYLEFQKITGTEFGIANDWWVQLLTPKVGDKLNSSEISAVITAFLYMPLQTLIGAIVLIFAGLNYWELKKQLQEEEASKQISKFLELISIVDGKLSDDLKRLQDEIIDNSAKDSDSYKELKTPTRFAMYMKDSLPTDMFNAFIRKYFPNGDYLMPQEEPISLYVDYYKKISDIDTHLGSSFGTSAASSISLLLSSIPKNSQKRNLEEEIYDILFKYLCTKLNHRNIDSRITIFNLAYSHFAFTGYFDRNMVNFFENCLKMISNSIQHTDDGDFFEKLFHKVVRSDDFLFSTAVRNNIKIHKVGGDMLKIIISDRYSKIWRIHRESMEKYSNEISNDNIFDSLQEGLYVDQVIFVK